MENSIEKAISIIVKNISTMPEVQSIGISGSLQFPKAGEGDIDVFIYCNKVPESIDRKSALEKSDALFEKLTSDIFNHPQWGIGDLVIINGLEIWLMYFTLDETSKDVDSIINGNHIQKIGDDYYPTGRLAMLKTINIMFERNTFLSSLKEKLNMYPLQLVKKIVDTHIYRLNDTENIERAVVREEVLLYHWALELALDSFLQILFAINYTYFPSRKRTLSYISDFSIKPKDCENRMLEIIKLGAMPKTIKSSYDIWSELVSELKGLI
jgi:hypothetical protein